MKAKYISVNEFIKKTEGKAVDFDHTAGVQCVDAIKLFNYYVYGDGADFDCGACGYAYGLWTNYNTNGVKNYFDKYDFKDAKKGDWIIWNKGSKNAPKSHVAMFIERISDDRVKAYGQNQNGNKAFNFENVTTDGILGVLRPKIYVKQDEDKPTPKPTPTPSGSFFPSKGYFSEGDNSPNVGKIASFMRRVFPAYTSEKALGNYYGKYIKASITEFQRRTGLKPDGCVGPITLAKLKQYGFKP